MELCTVIHELFIDSCDKQFYRVASWEVCIDSMGHSIRVAEGRGGGWLHGRCALTPWDTASELLKVEGEGGFMGGVH